MPDKPNIATQLFHDLGTMSPAEAEAKYGQQTVPTNDGPVRLSFVKPPSQRDMLRAEAYHEGANPPAFEPYGDGVAPPPHAARMRAVGSSDDQFRRDLVEQYGPGGYGAPIATGGLDVPEERRKHLEEIRAYANRELATVDAVKDMGPYQLGKTLVKYRDLARERGVNRDDVFFADLGSPDERLPDGSPVNYESDMKALGWTRSVTPPYVHGRFMSADPPAQVAINADMPEVGRRETLLHEKMHQRVGTAAEPEYRPYVGETTSFKKPLAGPDGPVDLNYLETLDQRLESAVASRRAALSAFEQDLHRMVRAVQDQKGNPMSHARQKAFLRHDPGEEH